MEVAYRVREVPDGGPAVGHLQQLADGSADEQQRAACAEAWHGRVRAVLADDSLFDVETVDAGPSDDDPTGGATTDAT